VTSADELGELRSRAADDAAGVIEELTGELADRAGDPDRCYLLAELLARAGRPADALRYIDDAAVGFQSAGRIMDTWRCDAGRTEVLGALGRHSEAAEAALRLLSNLGDPTGDEDRTHLAAGAHANLGACWESAGRYVDSLAEHDQAIALATALGDEVLAALMEVNRSNVLNLLGRSEHAASALRRAWRILEDAGEQGELPVVAINLGETECLLGRPDEGLAWFDSARQLLGADDVPDEAVVLVESADALRRLGAHGAARDRYRQALELVAHNPLGWIEPRAWFGLGDAERAEGDPNAAARAFARAAELFDAADNLPGAVAARLEATAASVDDPQLRSLATQVANAALDDIDPIQWPLQACLAHVRLAELVDDETVAKDHLVASVNLAKSTGIPHIVHRAEHALAHHLLDRGRTTEAEDHLDAAVAAIERIRGRLPNEALMLSFPRDTATTYDDVVRLRVGQGRIAAAFAAADASRSRVLLDGGILAPSTTIDPDVRQLEQALDALYDQFLGFGAASDGEGSRTGNVGELRRLDDRARRLEADLERLRFDRAAPRRSRDDLPSTAQPGRGSGEIELLYTMLDGQIALFVRHDERIELHRGLADLGAVVVELDAFADAGRRALAAQTAGIRPNLPRANVRLARLGELLLGPVWQLLEQHQVTDVTVVPHGPLHAVPFHALGPAGDTLIDRVAVTVAPSLGVQSQCAARRTDSARTVVVGQAQDDLPGIGEEVAALGRAIPGAVILEDGDATLAAVAEAASGAECLHLASHGIFRPEAPLQSGVRLADGWLTALRASRLGLNGALVVLSCCDTARTTVSAGEELLGLQRGFMQAGARNVVMSLWPTPDLAAGDLMLAFHEARLSGLRPIEALRAAQLGVRAEHPHPWWWAPFIVAGAG